jgi:predicted dehydrogenase
VSPNVEPVRWGMLGTAGIAGKAFLPALREAGDGVALTVASRDPARAASWAAEHGVSRGVQGYDQVLDDPSIEAVYIPLPNTMHAEWTIAALEAGKAVFCEKPVGGTPAQTVRIAGAASRAGVITGVGYNYRWAPLVQYAKQLIDSGQLGEITNYRGRFFSMYGADPMGLLSWRFLVDEAGHGVSSDILSHSVDLATMLVGPIERVTGTMETFIKERPLAKAGATHYAVGNPGDPTGVVTNEDYAGAMVVFASGARGTFETSRAIVGPESQMAFDVYGTRGALRWNLETMNQMEVFLVDEQGRAPRGYTTVFAGDRYPYHGHFVPGDANSIGYEDLKVIENFEFLSAVARGEQHEPGFAQAVEYVAFQAAWLRSCQTGTWEPVLPIGAA